MKKQGAWMDPDFNQRDSFHATIRHPRMSAVAWTAAYRDAWKAFYSKDHLIRILRRWRHRPAAYWNLFFVYLWYKNAALIEQEHPMIAGFLRLKARRVRRPGVTIDTWPVHAWKRTRELLCLIRSWVGFLKEMEEVWLATRPRSEREIQLFSEIERIQGEVWRALRIPDWQRMYAEAKDGLPATARRLLDPFEELAGMVLFTPEDLDRFLRRWGSLHARTQALYRRVAGQQGSVRRCLDALDGLAQEAKNTPNVHEWRHAYASVRSRLPSRRPPMYVGFDAASARVVYSRQSLGRLWSRTWEHLRTGRVWRIRPGRLVMAAVQEILLITSVSQEVMSQPRR